MFNPDPDFLVSRHGRSMLTIHNQHLGPARLCKEPSRSAKLNRWQKLGLFCDWFKLQANFRYPFKVSEAQHLA